MHFDSMPTRALRKFIRRAIANPFVLFVLTLLLTYGCRCLLSIVLSHFMPMPVAEFLADHISQHIAEWLIRRLLNLLESR